MHFHSTLTKQDLDLLSGLCMSTLVDAAHGIDESYNLDAYHARRHKDLMVHYALEAYRWYKNGSYINVITATLFHDVNHSLGKAKDDQNIKEALSSMALFRELFLRKDPNLSYSTTQQLIRATQYPYLELRECVTFGTNMDNMRVEGTLADQMLLMRDLDLCFIFLPIGEAFEHIFALYEEFFPTNALRRFATSFAGVTDEELFNVKHFIEKEIEFLRAVYFSSDWGAYVWATNKGTEKINALISALTAISQEGASHGRF